MVIDTTGTVNTAWKKHIPSYDDGTYSKGNAGFINRRYGTSCASCTYNRGGVCAKLEHGKQKVDEGDCCDFFEARETGTIGHLKEDVNLLTDRHVFKFDMPQSEEKLV